jgi:uncharacterized protein YyaL (SSP411 family)
VASRAIPAAALAVLLAAVPSAARAPQEADPPKGAPVAQPPSKDAPRPANRLAKESSPYLLQHAHNPVDWYPWGDEAFAKAKREDRPVFLSIGYSTCHWCHVMERESFENAEIAAYLNANFVAIKVDREERPDVDAVYMTAIQATGQGGGWPLSAFLDADRKPFFLGTYFPPEDRYGRPGFPTVLRKVKEAWTSKRDDVKKAGAELSEFVGRAFAPPPRAALSEATLTLAVRQFQARHDAIRGGFGDAPKFPRGHSLTALLSISTRKGQGAAREMALGTLRAMARGGMYDHVGGGFHRYSTDGAWLVPHFEKMLYDQALLAEAYVAAWQATGQEGFARTARETLDYVLRDLAHADGGLFCAEDADSEGVEGKFYLWTTAELKAALGAGEAAAAAKVFGARDSGNFLAEAEEAPPGANILHLPEPREAAARALGIEPAALDARIEGWRPVLLATRSKRVRPHRDDKVLAAWNGLAISALARAGRALGEPRYLAAAGRAADFLLGPMRAPDGRLRRTWRENRPGGPGFLDDHAFVARGLLDLYEATGDLRRLEQAVDLARTAVRLFSEEGQGALFDAAKDAPDLLARTREGEDWAVPSGNSAAAALLLRLERLGACPDLDGRGRAILDAYSGSLASTPIGSPALLAALDFDLGPTREVLLAGDPGSEGFRALDREISRRLLPRTVTARKPVGPDGERVAKLLPWSAACAPVDGKAAAYICEGGTCRAKPITDPAELGKVLDD